MRRRLPEGSYLRGRAEMENHVWGTVIETEDAPKKGVATNIGIIKAETRQEGQIFVLSAEGPVASCGRNRRPWFVQSFCKLKGRVGGPAAVASCNMCSRTAPSSSLVHLQPCWQNTTISTSLFCSAALPADSILRAYLGIESQNLRTKAIAKLSSFVHYTLAKLFMEADKRMIDTKAVALRIAYDVDQR